MLIKFNSGFVRSAGTLVCFIVSISLMTIFSACSGGKSGQPPKQAVPVGFHFGWMIAPREITMQCQTLKALSTGAASYPSEIMTAYLRREARGDLIKRFQKRAKTNFEFLNQWIHNHTEFFDWVEPDGGILCFPKYTMDIPSVDLCKYLFDTQKLLVNPGSYFNQEGFIRLSYGCDELALQSSLDALEAGLRKLEGRY